MRTWFVCVFLAGCSSSAALGLTEVDGGTVDAGGDASTPPPGAADGGGDGGTTPASLCTVTDMGPAQCTRADAGAPPAGSQCRSLTVTGCPGIESETIDATIAVLGDAATSRGTIVHFIGG